MQTLRQVDIRNDISSLVLASLESDPRLRRHNPELKGEIERALTKGAQGMCVIHKKPLLFDQAADSSEVPMGTVPIGHSVEAPDSWSS